MNAPAALQAQETANNATDWPLRYAQRAFAALIEDAAPARVGTGGFRTARLRAAAQRTVSALSADDRARLARWLAVLVASSRERESAATNHAVARVDPSLAANTEALLTRTREQLRQRPHAGAAA